MDVHMAPAQQKYLSNVVATSTLLNTPRQRSHKIHTLQYHGTL